MFTINNIYYNELNIFFVNILMSKHSKREYILKTLDLLSKEFIDDPDMQSSFKKLKDTVCHTAPEILNNRWTDICNFCRNNLNDTNNKSHIHSLRIYNSRLKEFKKIYTQI
jgi:hypothetical protein